ncbi:hypothetical protein BDC45DRAFT_569076 [Circinella umbellata]|nr:hypothetical protein BDC45DRAFT_569076 [Circinella umbellata]
MANFMDIDPQDHDKCFDGFLFETSANTVGIPSSSDIQSLSSSNGEDPMNFIQNTFHGSHRSTRIASRKCKFRARGFLRELAEHYQVLRRDALNLIDLHGLVAAESNVLRTVFSNEFQPRMQSFVTEDDMRNNLASNMIVSLISREMIEHVPENTPAHISRPRNVRERGHFLSRVQFKQQDNLAIEKF